MKYIISERQLRLLEMSPSIRRRLRDSEDYINNLDPKDICESWKSWEVDNYVNGVLSDAVLKCVIIDEDSYDEAYEYLSDKYRDYITEFFYNSLCDEG
jgi:hypothetical protein